MNFIYIISRFFMTVGKVYVQLLLNESPYMITKVITYVDVRKDYIGQM
jgi:hypothetical protein